LQRSLRLRYKDRHLEYQGVSSDEALDCLPFILMTAQVPKADYFIE
jgi:hypothetical protein